MFNNQQIVGKFERSQLPVGHGGFHLGTLEYQRQFLRYFFDCGGNKTGASVIQGELTSTDFEFGVISHFDKDHFQHIGVAKPKVMFIPYLDDTDIFFLMLKEYQISGKPSNVVAELRHALGNETKLVMVRHSPPGPKKTPESQKTPEPKKSDDDQFSPPNDDELGLLGVKATMQNDVNGVFVMSDSDDIHIGTKDHEIVVLRFYNHLASEMRGKFAAALVVALAPQLAKTSAKKSEALEALPALTDLADRPFQTVDEFLATVKKNPAKLIDKNSARLKSIFNTMLHKQGESDMTGSNLSSLTLFSRSVSFSNQSFFIADLHTKPPKKQFKRNINDGWMLTGDLELSGSVWRAFHHHYFLEIEHMVAFNIPHHGSAIALDDTAIHHIAACRHFIFPVNSDDPLHPALTLNKLLDSYGVRRKDRISVTDVPRSRFSLTRLYLQPD